MKINLSPANDTPTTSENQPSADQAQDSKPQAANKGKGKKPPPDPKEAALGLIRKSAGKIRLNIGQDFDGERLWYGIPTSSGKAVLINSDRKIFTEDDLPDPYCVHNSGLDNGFISEEVIQEVLSNKRIIDGSALFNELKGFFQDYIIFDDPRTYSAISLWVVGTYCYSIFRVFPYLSFRSASKECGKTRALELLYAVCFNASPRSTSPTEATLFRGTARNGGTILLDEIEGLASEKDRLGQILSVLNTGFEQGGSVSRLRRLNNGEYLDIKFSTYSPKAVAGINKLADTLEGRSITIYLKRKRREEKIKRYSSVKVYREQQPLRDQLRIWCLSNASRLDKTYREDIATHDALNCLGDRDRDLWEPLLSIAMVIEGKAGLNGQLMEDMLAYASDKSQEKYSTEDEAALKLVERLDRILGDSPVLEITPTELLEAFKEQEYILSSTKALANLLLPIGFKAVNKHIPGTSKSPRLYTITRQEIDDLKASYLRPDSPALPLEKA